MTQTDYARWLERDLKAMKVPHEKEFRFHSVRKWRADFKLLSDLLVEVDGGGRMAAISRKTGKPIAVGRHSSDADYEKLNAAAAAGYRVLRFTTRQVRNGQAIKTIINTIEGNNVS